MLANMVCTIYTPGNAVPHLLVLLVLVLLAMQKLPRQASRRVYLQQRIMMGRAQQNNRIWRRRRGLVAIMDAVSETLASKTLQ